MLLVLVSCSHSITTKTRAATTFTGMFYLGYVPSFWVRIRTLDALHRPPTRLAKAAAPALHWLGQRWQHYLPAPLVPVTPITSGAIFVFWTWLCLAFNDVAAYFGGRKYGKTPLTQWFPATPSPNKTVEGVVAGCVTSVVLGMVGAWVQRWPWPLLTGAGHGMVLGLLGLLGDLTASVLKRDAGQKDFGNLLPEHGGILDRVDGFVWTAPYSWLVVQHVLPALGWPVVR